MKTYTVAEALDKLRNYCAYQERCHKDVKDKLRSMGMISQAGYKTEYYYLWNDWFLRDEYDDVKKYIKSVGCKYFIDEIDFNELGIN